MQILKDFGDEQLDNAIVDTFDNAIFERIRWRTFWLNGILDAFDNAIFERNRWRTSWLNAILDAFDNAIFYVQNPSLFLILRILISYLAENTSFHLDFQYFHKIYSWSFKRYSKPQIPGRN